MDKKLLVIAAWLGAFSVALGAFGAHILKGYLSPQSLITYETAVRYQFYHVFAIALAGLLYQTYSNKRIRLAGNLFIAGIIFFSGSLYCLSILKSDHFKWIGAITPMGGIFFMAGWVLLALGIRQGKAA
ncbi:MAG: DUF423 domain-containing protein [Chitinophagaceae bacterium]|nr:DUF423 domain-containing protein [Chitinophagaceae bacterium]MDP1765088.1 DUF423 domain-containing protein [Sediminibacterium sp.]MDP1810296.1 DUF423 domain-containing protein [Sediminibacterium sp.]MDP3128787.1 DUF423 domain-containing protein [Sediminibacterium sp.]MDP3665956.1 DUF423 domain-containing protein [Sediminibacterium sp.]